MVSRGVKRASKFYHSFMNSAEATPGTSSEHGAVLLGPQ